MNVTLKEETLTKVAIASTRAMDEERSIPRVIGGYRIIEILGEGGMSVVYTAMQEHPRRKVAIKVLRGSLYSPNAAKRFHQEVEILGKLDHPWIAKIYDAGSHDDGNGVTPFYVMELVSNARELKVYLDEVEPERREVLKLFAMICSAVEHGHRRRIVHRDLKPGNILIDSNGEPKIIDFGVARSIDRRKVNEQAMTEAGRLVGTVQFMAPEQVDTTITDIDARCDVYALGVVLYQMLIRRLPRTLEGLPIYEAVRQICQEDPVRPTVYDDSIDQDLEAIIMKSLETDRQKRYQSAGAFGRDIVRYLGDRPIKARRVTPLARIKLFCRRHKKQLLLFGFIVPFVIAVVWIVLALQSSSEKQIGNLQDQVNELSKKQDEIVQPVLPITPPEPATPIYTLPSTPLQIAVSTDGSTLAATFEDEFYACSVEGEEVVLPNINVDPSAATIVLSSDGNTIGIVSSNRCRIINLVHPNSQQRMAGQFEGVTALAVNSNTLAIGLDDMSLQLCSEGNKAKRALSTTGAFLEIAINQSFTTIAAATDHWFYVWDVEKFPKNVQVFEGVTEPRHIVFAREQIFVLGRGGQIIEYHPLIDTAPRNMAIHISGSISYAASNAQGTELGCIANGIAYRYELLRGTVEEVTWMPEVPVGIAFTANNQLVLWTADGEIFQGE